MAHWFKHKKYMLKSFQLVRLQGVLNLTYSSLKGTVHQEKMLCKLHWNEWEISNIITISFQWNLLTKLWFLPYLSFIYLIGSLAWLEDAQKVAVLTWWLSSNLAWAAERYTTKQLTLLLKMPAQLLVKCQTKIKLDRGHSTPKLITAPFSSNLLQDQQFWFHKVLPVCNTKYVILLQSHHMTSVIFHLKKIKSCLGGAKQ